MALDIFTLKQDIMTAAELGAAALLKMEKPLSDELTTSQAHKLVGRIWFEKYKDQLTSRRKGTASNSAIIYSRLEIMALKKAQSIRIENIIK